MAAEFYPPTHLINDDDSSVASEDSYLAEFKEDAELIRKCKKDIDYLFQLAGVQGIYNYRMKMVSGEVESNDDSSWESLSGSESQDNQQKEEQMNGEADSDFGEEGSHGSIVNESMDDGSIASRATEEEQEIIGFKPLEEDDWGVNEVMQPFRVIIEFDFEEDEDDFTWYDRPKEDSEIDAREAHNDARDALEVLMQFEKVSDQRERNRRHLRLARVFWQAQTNSLGGLLWGRS